MALSLHKPTCEMLAGDIRKCAPRFGRKFKVYEDQTICCLVFIVLRGVEGRVVARSSSGDLGIGAEPEEGASDGPASYSNLGLLKLQTGSRASINGARLYSEYSCGYAEGGRYPVVLNALQEQVGVD